MRRTTIAGRLAPAFSFAGMLVCSSVASADVNVETTPVRDYQLPGTFTLDNARVLDTPRGETVIVNTMGSTPEESKCGVVIADNTSARLIEYRYKDAPTACIGSLVHPAGGVFLRGSNPVAVEGEVTGFTALLGEDDAELWAIDDQDLVAAQPVPNGTGEFQGAYVTPHPAMAYSTQLDKLLAFTIGKLTIGADEKFLSQAHVANVGTGRVTTSGQTFGLSGVGNVGGAATRTTDGNFLIYYYSSGDQGAFFYDYNGRQDIEFFKPRGEDWDDRFVLRMIYRNELLHLLWTPSDGEDPQTRVTATTDSGAELWSTTLEPEYRFADGELVNLGMPLTMWVSRENLLILHQDATMELFVRVLDRNGESLGVSRLTDVTEFPPVAIVNGANDTLKVISFDQENRHLFEHAMTFTDVEDFDPDAGIPDTGFPGDIGIPGDIGLKDVLEAAGCCATVSPRRDATGAWLVVLLGLTVALRRRRT